MKKLFFMMLVSMSLTTYAQSNEEPLYPFIYDDTLFATEELIFIVGKDVVLGTGTMPNGDFKYITTSRGNWVSAMNATAPIYIGSKWSGHKFRIKDFKKYGTKKRGFTFYLLLGGGNIVNYECDVLNALKTGEIVVDGYTPVNQRPMVVNQQLSKADELKKLKTLKDDGTLTEEEYQAEKKKLLDSK